MSKPVPLLVAMAMALATAGALQAHHSGSAYSTKPLRISGPVIRFEPSNPRAFTHLGSRADDGSLERWVVDGPSRALLGRVQGADYSNEHTQVRQLYYTQTSCESVQSDDALRECVAAFNALLENPCV